VIAAILLFCIFGLMTGALLLRGVPLCPAIEPVSDHKIPIIIPARNEERNLPRLLGSIKGSRSAAPSVMVVDDASTDATASVAAAAGAAVISSHTLPAGWTGKTWACAQGAEAAIGTPLLFLDADTWLAPGGLDRLLSAWNHYSGTSVVLSLLPFHVTQAPYEQLSLFFNLLMAFGAGGFGRFGKPALFGQCLLISREMYEASGGHGGVRGRILENFAMADRIQAANGLCVCLGGRGVLNVRMFPSGISQLCESWRKAFADGAAASETLVLSLSIIWLTALCTIFLLLCTTSWPMRGFAAALYLLAAAQVHWSARQLGTFGWTTALLYPVPLLFFFGLFASSLSDRIFHRQVAWRGRRI
jgi:4,4'-diaponeurosporenoate glycosyltransferase